MNTLTHRFTPQRLLAVTAMTLLLATTVASAAPGAHGPNGEHLDAPATAQAGAARPRVEARSDLFELVATLHGGELSVLIDRYETNEPVLGATLELESGGVKAKGVFHADQGDYAFDDPKLLALLRTPGEHAVVFTLVAGSDSDLLDGTLVGATAKDERARAAGGDAHGHDHGHGHELERAAWIGASVAALGLFGGITWWRRRRRETGKLQGALS